jgi:LysM repeat protein
MKMPRLPKVPKFMLPRPRRKAPQKLAARVKTADPAMMDYDEEEPQTKLTSAFVVVLVLHLVAVGGIYAFNQIKTSRRPMEALLAPAERAEENAPDARMASQPQDPAPAVAPAPAAAVAQPREAAPAPIARQRVHNVKAGDTLHAIARTYGTNVPDLKLANRLASDAIRPGQILNIPAPRPVSRTEVETVKAEAPKAPAGKAAAASDAKSANTTHYTVKSGDRLIFIAKKYNVSPEEIAVASNLKDPGKLQVGQVLKIPVKPRN